jgi:hypothetical protein
VKTGGFIGRPWMFVGPISGPSQADLGSRSAPPD